MTLRVTEHTGQIPLSAEVRTLASSSSSSPPSSSSPSSPGSSRAPQNPILEVMQTRAPIRSLAHRVELPRIGTSAAPPSRLWALWFGIVLVGFGWQFAAPRMVPGCGRWLARLVLLRWRG
jgi:hypothetical protein